MPLAAEKEMAHIGESQGAADHDHDMIHELSKRLDALWRYDQYVANADGHIDLQNFWQEVKEQEKVKGARCRALPERMFLIADFDARTTTRKE